MRASAQAKAVNEVVNAMDFSSSGPDSAKPLLRVINGMSTPTASTLTTVTNATTQSPPVDGLPAGELPRSSTIRWAAGGGVLMTHHEQEDESDQTVNIIDTPPMTPAPRKPIQPSLETLEKAVAARIYFENLYFPLLRQTPSREQRRLAMEKDMEEMQLTEARKQQLRAQWRQNETDYLRERRHRVDVNAFVKLKTIGHGE